MRSFFAENFILLMVAGADLMLPVYKFHNNDRHGVIHKVTSALIVLLAISEYLERSFALQAHPSFARVLLSVICYCIRPLILLLFFYYIDVDIFKKWFFPLPEAINILIYCTAFFSGIAFSYNDSNAFIRGPLGYTQHVVSSIYGFGLFFLAVKSSRKGDRFEHYPIMFELICLFLTMILETGDFLPNLSKTAMLVCSMYYEFFLYRKYTQTDVLTGLYNRFIFYRDIVKYRKSITSVIQIDMNGLKLLNDSKGHEAGDEALQCISACIRDSIRWRSRAYRIGGDEFVVLCSDEEPNSLADNIRCKVEENGYSVSAGVSSVPADADILEYLRLADEEMYTHKEAYYASAKRSDTKYTTSLSSTVSG